ncbi:MAG: hypothetical protein JEY97_13345 [Bacteroidales bacterium]|nr:hypothetical protein [Bacteroidales bacterium]
MDINKQIEYWKSGAINDIDTAELLINNNKLFMACSFVIWLLRKLLKLML